MDKYEYKLEKLKAKIDQEKALVSEMTNLAKNPIVEYIAGMLFIMYLVRPTSDEDASILVKATKALLSAISAGSMGLNLTAIITAQQIAPSIPYLAQAGLQLIPSKTGGLLK